MADQLKKKQLSELHDAFMVLDTNGDGFINILELKDALISKGVSPSDNDVRRLMETFDIDEDKQLNCAEFMNFMGKVPNICEENKDPEMVQLFQHFDRDNDGYITYEEIRRALKQSYGNEVSHKEVQEMLDQADTDNDGKLTFEEFEAVMKKCHGP